MHRRQLILNALAGAFLVACGGTVSPPTDAPGPDVVADPDSNFHAVYDDPVRRERFKLFLTHVFHLYPEDDLHQLVLRSTRSFAGDEAIFKAIVAGLPDITPTAATLRYALPALNKQKKVMVAQAAALVGEGSRVDGYVEIGTVGRYRKGLGNVLTFEGPSFVVNDREPSKDPADIVERGTVAEAGTFLELGRYTPLDAAIEDASIGLVTNYIGFHHCPDDALEGFITSIRRVLRPGGHLVLREHDVDRPEMARFVALAHDVFNAGTQVDWAGNKAELRHFRSVAAWTAMLEGLGLRRIPGEQRQDGDPTDTVLMAFQKV